MTAALRSSSTASSGWALTCSIGAVLLGWTEAHAERGAAAVSAYLDVVALFGLPLGVAAALLRSAPSPTFDTRAGTFARYGGNRRRSAAREAGVSSLLLACTLSPLLTLGLLGVPGQVPARDLWITLEVTWLGALALSGLGLFVRAWLGRVGLVLLLLAEWASALPTSTPLPLLPTAHVGHLLAVGPELETAASGSFLLLAISAVLGHVLAGARVRP